MKAVNRKFSPSGWTTTNHGKTVYRYYRAGGRMVTKTLSSRNLVQLVEEAIAARQSVEKILAMLEDSGAIAS